MKCLNFFKNQALNMNYFRNLDILKNNINYYKINYTMEYYNV